MGLSRNRHGTFEVRQVVPEPVRAKVGRREFRVSLRTKDEREALRRLPEEQRRIAELIASANSDLTLSPREAQVIADRWLAAQLQADERARREADYPEIGPDPLGEAAEDPLDAEIDAYIEAARENDFSVIADEVDQVLRVEGLSIARRTTSWNRLAVRMALAKAELIREQQRRNRGDWSGGQSQRVAAYRSAPPGLATAPGAVVQVRPGGTAAPTLEQLVGRWAEERAPSYSTLSEWQLTARVFTEVVGDVPVDSIAKRDVVAFKDHVIKTSARSATARKKLAAVKSLLRYALANDLIGSDPGLGVRIAKTDDDDSRQPFSIDQLNAIFGQPVFTLGKRPVGGAGEAAYWIPVLALYTGARLEELAQLAVADVRREDGATFIDINGRDGRRLKNKSSWRKVPLHPHVMALGFNRYIASLDPTGDVFPLVKNSGKGQRSKNYSKWFARLISVAGIAGDSQVFHSFRHSFKDACRDAGVPKDVHDRLTGHASRDVGDRYGVGYSIKRLDEEISRVEWKGLTIPKWRR